MSLFLRAAKPCNWKRLNKIRILYHLIKNDFYIRWLHTSLLKSRYNKFKSKLLLLKVR